MSDKVREAFEAAWDSWGWSDKPAGFWDTEKSSYTDPAIQWAWQGYRAAQSPSQPLVEVQEPIGEVWVGSAHRDGFAIFWKEGHKFGDGIHQLYAAPVRGLPLTEIQVEEIALKDEFWWDEGKFKWKDFAVAIQKAVGISPKGGNGEAK